MRHRSTSLIILLAFVGCLMLSIRCFSQTKRIDSLREVYYHDSDLLNKKKAITQLCENYHSLSPDSLFYYVQLGTQLIPSNTIEYFHILVFKSEYLFKKGQTLNAILFLDSLDKKCKSIPGSKKIQREIAVNKVSALIMNSRHKEAIEKALELLTASELAKDTLHIMRTYSILGWIHMELENESEAINFLKKGLSYSRPESSYRIRSLYNNLASTLNNTQQMDSAFHYIELGIQCGRDNQNLTVVANGLNIRAAMHLKQQNIHAAELDLEQALKAREMTGDMDIIIADMAQLSSFYAYSNQTKKGIMVAKKGIELAKQNENLAKLIFTTEALADNYKNAKLYNEAIASLTDLIHLKDSLNQKNSSRDIAEMFAKYELQKKENIIMQQKNHLTLSRYITFGSILALLLGSLIIWLIYQNRKHIQEQELQQAIAEEKINSMKAIQDAEEKERKRIAADLHDNLGSYAAAITSNIRYLKEKNNTDSSQIIHQLDENAQGIVTQLSDSIWVLKNEHLHITKLADRFKSWAQKIILNYPHVKYFYLEDISKDAELTPAKILNIFLILKECLNNSLKHSDCNEVRITFNSNPFLNICIEDNGKGFESNLLHSGNGIENIKFRANESNLQVKWENIQPVGTSVLIYEESDRAG